MRLLIRRVLLWGILFVWMVVALCRAAYLAGPARAGYMRQADILAGREGAIPATRGRLLDCNNIPVAWDEAHFELLATPEWNPGCAQEISTILQHPVEVDESRIIAHRLTPDEVVKLEELERAGFPVRIRYRCERIVAVSADKRNFIIQLEAKYDDVLRGKDGRYHVLLDRYQSDIPESWQLLEAPQNGGDVVLDISLEEIEAR